MKKECKLIQSGLWVGEVILVNASCPVTTKRLSANSCSRNNVNFFVFAERQLETKQESRALGCPQISGTLQWIQYKDHCYAFDMAFYNFSVYNVEDAKKVCQKLSMFRLSVILQLVISLLFEKESKSQQSENLHWLYFSFYASLV